MKLRTVKGWLIFSLCLLIIIIGYFLLRAVQHNGKTTIIVLTSPRDSKITIQGKKASSKNYLSPGEYIVKAERQGFKPTEKRFLVKKGERMNTVIIIPEADNSGLEYLKNNPGVQKERESLAGEESQKEGNEFRKQSPLISRLPYENPQLGFSLDYAKDKSGNAEIEVRGNTPFARKYALQQVQDWGYNTTDYTFRFIDLLNVFEARKQ